MKQTRTLNHASLLLSAFAVLLLAACGSSKDDKKIEGPRVSILEAEHKLEVDHTARSFKPRLPTSVINQNWPQAGGNIEHNLLHPALPTELNESWRVSIGEGSGGDFRLLARPVISEGHIFTLDAQGQVSAFKTKDGDRIWRLDTTPDNVANPTIGGGLGISGNIIFVTTGYGEIMALTAEDGKILWRKSFGKPLRCSPTIADQRVYVVSIDNELQALDAKTGEVLWHHNGIAESATLMGSSSPAVAGDDVVVTYSSGEIYSLRAMNGHVAWSDVLSAPAQVGALPAIADIRGLPVIDHGRVFAVSHSGRAAAIDLRTGERSWEIEIGGVNTPAISGEVLYLLTNENELVALTRDTGRVIWIKELAKLTDPSDHESKPVFWSGPLLAGGRLWLANTLGHMVGFAPQDGEQVTDLEVGAPMFMAPVVADNTLYVVTDDGHLVAFR